MPSKILSIAALFGAAVYACDGPSYQHHKRADGDIGMLKHMTYNVPARSNLVNSMVIR
jgi:hypothetical protein